MGKQVRIHLTPAQRAAINRATGRKDKAEASASGKTSAANESDPKDAEDPGESMAAAETTLTASGADLTGSGPRKSRATSRIKIF